MSDIINIILYTPDEPEEWLAALREAARELLPAAQIHRYDDPSAAPSSIADARYAVVWAPPAELFTTHRDLRAICTLGAGVDALIANPGVPVALPIIRVEDSGMAPQMAEYALLAALYHLRHFGAYGAAQRAARWEPLPLLKREAVRVGILGAGVLGAHVAGVLADFGFPVAAWSRTPRTIPGIECVHGDAGLTDLLARTDVLVILVPLTAATRGLLNAARLALLPRGATLVNLARGPIVDEAALLSALEEGQLGHAFLDVFAAEPLPAENPLWGHPQVTITPHVAALTPPADAARQIIGKIVRLKADLPVSGLVDRGRGY